MKFKSAFIVIFSFMLALLATWSASAKSLSDELVNYANNYAEFSVALPEAPTVKTIWADGSEPIPYIKTNQKSI